MAVNRYLNIKTLAHRNTRILNYSYLLDNDQIKWIIPVFFFNLFLSSDQANT